MTRPDVDIERHVANELCWDNRVDASDINIIARDGRVILDGFVPTYSALRSAEQDCFNVPGVISVENRLKVKPMPFISAPDDEKIAHCVQNVLNWSPDINSNTVKILVQGGWVTLEGVVDSFWKKLKAEDLTANIVGVMGITNKIGIVPSEAVEDRAIADSVIDAIDRNTSVDVDSVDVRVQEGIVTLSGVVSSRVAYSTAESIASRTKGVVEVRNNIDVT